ncbi:MAG: ATP-grasp domain-containing protein [Patescibacteria group bacterium]
MPEKVQRNIIAFIYSTTDEAIRIIKSHHFKGIENPEIAIIGDSKLHTWKKKAKEKKVDHIITVDFDKPLNIAKQLQPYQDRLAVIVCRTESKMRLLAKVLPHVPYLKTPTVDSLHWISNKIAMRRRLRMADKKINPRFLVVHDDKNASIKKIMEKVTLPVVLKPTTLAASLYVTPCYHEEELRKSLSRMMKQIKRHHKMLKLADEPEVLVEEMMEGVMYSIDAYVTSRGGLYFCPMVHIKTGRSIGFDDFFGYQQICPPLLRKESIDEAKRVASTAIHALGLRSVTAHVELMKTEHGWKIIEVAGRVGGFRHYMYENSFGFSHTLNDIRVRVPEKPIINRKRKGYTAAMKFFAEKEGELTKLTGLKKAEKLESFVRLLKRKKIGEKCRFAKHGGKSVFEIILFNKERSRLLSDIRRLEQMVVIEVKNGNGKKKRKK